MTEMDSRSRVEQLYLAEGLFLDGRFAAAGKNYGELADSTEKDPRVLVRLGQINLLENRLEAAADWFRLAETAGANTVPLLAETFYRARLYPEAAACYARAGHPGMADHLTAFGDREPYSVQPGPAVSQVEFLTREPLPLVRVLVNGLEEALFVFDTGSWDTVVDVALARRAGLPRGCSGRVGCADGRDAWVEYSRLNCLTVGGMEIADLPVQVMDLGAALGGFFEPHGVDGVIGLGALSRFGVELDMASGVLRLYREPGELETFEPCWLGGGRQVLVWGEINGQPNLWFLDTGMTGFDCLVPDSTANAARLGERGDGAAVGYGGGGQVALNTADIDTLVLGDLHKAPARAVISPGFPLERRYGFRIGGLLALEFLKGAVLRLDFARMQFGLHRPASA